MKFTDGFWLMRHGVTVDYAAEAYDISRTDDTPDGPGLVVHAPTQGLVYISGTKPDGSDRHVG